MLKTQKRNNRQREVEGGENVKKSLYFAYGSNMNLDQMDFRCPAAKAIGVVRLEDYRLAFCGGRVMGDYAGVRTEPGQV